MTEFYQDDTTYYNGQGVLLISSLNQDFVPTGYEDLASVISAEITIKSNQLVHKSSRQGVDLVDDALVKDPIATLKIIGKSFNYDVLAKFLGGEVLRTEAGAVNTTTPIPVIAGMIYPLEHPGHTDLVITNLAEDIIYEEDVNYSIHGTGNSFKVLSVQEQTDNGATEFIDNAQVVVSYSFEENIELITRLAPLDLVAVRFEGLNTAEDNKPVIVDIPKVAPQFLTGLALVSKGTDTWEVTSTLVAETKAGTSKFFRQKTLL